MAKEEVKLTAEQQLAAANKKIKELEAKQEAIRLTNERQKILNTYPEGERKNLIKFILENSKDPEMVHKKLTKDILVKPTSLPKQATVIDRPQSYVDFNVEQPKNVKTEMTDEEYTAARFKYVINNDNNGGW